MPKVVQHYETYNECLKKLECSICKEFNITPTKLDSCDHQFCFKCVNGLKKNAVDACPICRDEISLHFKPSVDLEY